jgi:hypothetical protein
MATEITAKGDLIVGTGSGTFDNLPAGTNGFTLVADSSVSPTGLKWAVDPVADVVTTAGDLIYGTAADTVARLGIGTAGQVLKVNSGATAPEWGAASSTPTFVGCAVSNTATFSIANNTSTVLTFDTELYDTDSFHSTSTNTSRITIPSGKSGYYQTKGSLRFAPDGTGVRTLSFRVNGNNEGLLSEYKGDANSTDIDTGVITFYLNAGDYIEVFAFQNSGGALTLYARREEFPLQVTFLGA